MDRAALISRVLDLDRSVRYVAIGSGQTVVSLQREDVSDASAGESDRYEELLVNPTLLLLARQRGEIDCGGLDFVIVAYGSFYQLVMPIDAGHISVCVEKDGDPIALAPRVGALVHGI